MKSMILKDYYNIRHNIRMMLFMIVFMAVCIMPSSGPEGMIAAGCVICCMITVTTFSFDEKCKWEKYALIMPVSRWEYVMGKYVMNILFGLFGFVSSLLITAVYYIITGKTNIPALIGCSIVGIVLMLVIGSIQVPLIIRFGAENARIVMIAATAVPVLLMFMIYKLLPVLHIQITDRLVIGALAASAVLIIGLTVGSYFLSLKWFKEKEF